jgi:hypothetical protein
MNCSRPLALSLVVLAIAAVATTAPALAATLEYRVLATSKTATMEKELNEAAAAGFHFAGVMGGETAMGGSEVVAIVQREAGTAADPAARYSYKLLAASKTSTMQKEMQEAADGGFRYVGQTVFSSAFGGEEVVVIMERPPAAEAGKYQYLLLATSKTSTMEKELAVAGENGYSFVGTTVSKTKLGGNEIVSILRRPALSAAK